MADDWEDWEDEGLEPALPGVAAAVKAPVAAAKKVSLKLLSLRIEALASFVATLRKGNRADLALEL